MSVTNIPPKFTFTYDGATLNIYHANKGQGLSRHQHIHAHATFCTAGSCAVRKEGKEVIVDKDFQPINLIAAQWHEIEALEDGTIFINVFASHKHM